ncbi:MAG: glycosyltransferase [Fibrobacteria bacterium]|nr:glycosyltransferase [Fibrobacteria bacterium]
MITELPKISIVTPSYNQGQYLEQTICSVLDQEYPNLEYIVIDGGSTDNSTEIIKKYADQLSYCESVPDKGQYHAINKGFQHSTGDIMAWLNSDDMYMPWTLKTVADIFQNMPDENWITTVFPIWWDEQGRAIRCTYNAGFTKKGFFRGEFFPGYGPFGKYNIQQESTFWRRSLWETAGSSLDEQYLHAGDFELWARFYQHADLLGVETILAGYRRHKNQKCKTVFDAYFEESKQIAKAYGIRRYTKFETFLLMKLTFTISDFLKQVAKKCGLLYPRSFARNYGWGHTWYKETIKY